MSNSSIAQPEQSLGSLAVQIPGATAVFRKLKLDFCCGGQQSLNDACASKQLDVNTVLDEIRALQEQSPPPDAPDTTSLIAHILQRFHEVHRQQLPELIRMARRVEAVHREHPDVPRGLADHLEDMEEELLEHMAKEEQILFPMLLAGGNPMVVHPIGMMRHEHLGHGAQLEKLAALARQHKAPAGACNTWRALYAGTARLTDDLIEHIHLENNRLFPAFERPAQH
ncbi:iron-sulfur cluster repair protein YtfE [Piscinibacterium candidicorallinum]|jgi:regulator of cell morphogenesis and NO signaling|uniref:Iron-sulfur cluster repair protein YtfE n=1 Tax=Piscinibacterium candidicorallinum TaxID=1793872 RepID=A0ABV7H937_9BURK